MTESKLEFNEKNNVGSFSQTNQLEPTIILALEEFSIICQN